MRTFTHRLLIALFLIVISRQTFAQLYSGTAFLQGCYIEVAVADCGVYGSSDAPPSSGPFGPYHDNAPAGLGFVADHEKDGWAISTGAGEPDFCGDYFTPGTPEEGWAIEYSGDVWYNHYVPCSGGDFDIPGSVVGYSDTGGYKSATWAGEIDDIDLTVEQYTIFPDGALFFLTSVTLCNDGVTDLNDVYYMRNVDPDQDQPICGTFSTHNFILNLPPASDTALVAAIGDICGCYLGIGTIDDRARVSTGYFFTTDGNPSESWAGTGGYMNSTPATGYGCDCAIQIAFKVDIPAGECTTINFAHILDPSDLEEALQATLVGGIGIASNGVEIDSSGTVNKCELDTVLLTILYGEDYDWTWSPSYGLSADTGVSVYAYPDTTTTYTITGVGECAELIRQITINVHQVLGLANAGPDTIICPEDTINLQGSGGVTYLWQPPVYLTDVTDPSSAVNNPLTDIYYYLIAFDEIGCPDTDIVYIDLKERPEVNAGSDKVMAIGTFTQLFGSGAATYVWSPGETLSDSSVYNPYAYPGDTIMYTLNGTDMYGCENWDSVYVFVIDPAYILNPNIFSPNDDGVNDSYIPNVEGLGELMDFQIYNRWGVLVYDWNTGERGWDGYFEGKPQELGTYIILITAHDVARNIEVTKTANVILMR